MMLSSAPSTDNEYLNGKRDTSTHNEDEEQERLSSDLALFLSNPNLKSGLSDGSLDLTSLSSVVENELNTLEHDCIEIYRKHSSEISSLRSEIEVCDGVLANLQEMLLGFQADLGGLSGDIRALQDQSRTLGIRLRNRRNAEASLRLFLEKVVIPPNLADVICHGIVDDLFLECVKELQKKYHYVHNTKVDSNPNSTDDSNKSSEQLSSEDALGIVPPQQTISGNEMKYHIQKLRLRAVTRTREYFLSKILELRRPKTNVRMIQVNALLKYAALNDFLQEAAPEIYSEVREIYVESMGRTLGALFRTYMAQLSRLDSKIATRYDLIAIEDANLRDVFSSKVVNLSKNWDTFFLGDRAAVLDSIVYTSALDGNNLKSASEDVSLGPILAHVAQAEGLKYPYERIFWSVMLHLMDSATNEFVFTRKFFKASAKSAHNRIFSRVLSLVLEQLENYLFNCYDCLGLLLMIKITHANRRIMKLRKVHVLDTFFAEISMLLWPRLKMVMDAQIRSVRLNTKKLGKIETHAHYVSRRYAEFTCSILLILNKGKNQGHKQSSSNTNTPHQNRTMKKHPSSSSMGSNNRLVNLPEESPAKPSAISRARSSSSVTSNNSRQHQSARGTAGDMLIQDLGILTQEMIYLLERLSDEHPTNKQKIVFMINNLDQINTVFAERKVAGKEMTQFRDLLIRQREQFVEEELLQNFSKMIAFVQQTETHFVGLSSGDRLEVNSNVVENLVRDFASSWKAGIEQINKNVLTYFSNFRNGMEILKQVLTQLLLYYTRFQDIIRKVWRSKPPAFCKDLVSTTVILAEIKKHALSI